MTFGEKIKKIRQDKGISQRELGIRLGVRQQTVAQYEKIEEPPKFETIRRIAEALEVPFDEVIPFDDGLKLWIKEKKEEKMSEHHLAATANGQYTIYVNSDRNNPLNIALKKLDDGEPLTPEERRIIKEYVNSDMFREKIAQLPAQFKKLADSIKRNYELLNTEGKKEADKQVELANKQIELLTKIPEYRKEPDKTEAPEE